MCYLIAGTCYVCTETRGCRRFINGWRCAQHAPPNPIPDPEQTAKALRRRRRLGIRELTERT